MRRSPLQLLVITGEMDTDYWSALRELDFLLVDQLHDGEVEADIDILPLRPETVGDEEYDALLERRWSHLLIAVGRDHREVGEWRRLIERIVSSSPPPSSIFLLADWTPNRVSPYSLQELLHQGSIPLHIIEFHHERDFEERRRPSGHAVHHAASEIVRLILGDEPSSIRDTQTHFLRAEAPTATSMAAAAEAFALPARPEPNSPTTLLARRTKAKVERFYVPEAKPGRRPPSSLPASGDLRHSLIKTEDKDRRSSALASIASRKDHSPVRTPRSAAPPDALSKKREANEDSAAIDDRYAARRINDFLSNASAHPSASPPRSATSHLVKWLLLGTSTALLAAFLYRRELGALLTPLVKLFGSMTPPAASVGPPAADSNKAENVELAAFAPPMCAPGETILVQALLHLPADQSAAYSLAVAADPTAVRKAIQTLSIALRNGEEIAVDLEAEGCSIDEPRQTTVWKGGPVAVQFFATVPRQRKKPVPVRIIAMRSGVPVGSVRFTVPVQAGAEKHSIELRGEEAKRFTRAFVSYASEDRVSVLGYAQALSLTGIEIFQDVLSLGPGERWEQRLYAEIDRSDLFVLFWSHAASQSKWVVAEAEYALRFANESDSQSPVIRPFLLEGPPIPTIPDSLQSIHFNDKFRYMILGAKAAAEARRNVPPPN
jgi:hypothetical protein